MKALSKFFTPPLAPRDRELFFRCLGLEQFEYLLVETCGSLTLRAKIFRGLESRALLGAPPADSQLPVLLVKHPSQQLVSEPMLLPKTLWEEVFPYPFSLFGRLFSDEPDPSLSFSSPVLKGHLKLLWEAFNSLEEKMSATEVSCLWLKGGSDTKPLELPVLFHYVRRRRVRVGTASHLAPLGARYLNGELSPEALRNQFGTYSAFYYLGLEGLGTGSDLLPSLVDRILRMLEAAETSEAAPSLTMPDSNPFPPPDLSPPLEL